MSTLQPGIWLQCIGPCGPGSALVVGANYRCLAVDQAPERCKVHAEQGCGGVMVDGAAPSAGFWFCERLFKPIDDPGEDLLARLFEKVAA